MKKLMTTSIAVIALTAIFAGSASAAIDKRQLNRDIRSSLSTGTNIRVVVNNGTVTISGYYADSLDRAIAIRKAKNTEGVTRVINLAYLSS